MAKEQERWPRSLLLQKEGTLRHTLVEDEPAGPSCQAGGSAHARAAKALAHQSSFCSSSSPKSTDGGHQGPDGGCGISLSASPLLVSS